MKMTGRKGISAAVLKNTALILMVINHFSVAWYREIGRADWFYDFQWYLTRPAFILFAFLISEGMAHTGDREKYMLRLLGTGAVSEYFYDRVLIGTVPYPGAQNVFFTLFLGALAIYLIDRYKSRPAAGVLIAFSVSALASLTGAEYGIMGVGIILIFYYLRDRRVMKLIVCGIAIFGLWFAQSEIYGISGAGSINLQACLKSAAEEAHGVLAFPLILLYNGERGRQLPKLFYYLFYPCHLAVIAAAIYAAARFL